MCLATVYVKEDETPREVASNVTHMEKDGDTLTFIDLLGRKTTVQGTIYQMEFTNTSIYIEQSA